MRALSLKNIGFLFKCSTKYWSYSGGSFISQKQPNGSQTSIDEIEILFRWELYLSKTVTVLGSNDTDVFLIPVGALSLKNIIFIRSKSHIAVSLIPVGALSFKNGNCGLESFQIYCLIPVGALSLKNNPYFFCSEKNFVLFRWELYLSKTFYNTVGIPSLRSYSGGSFISQKQRTHNVFILVIFGVLFRWEVYLSKTWGRVSFV